MKRRFKSLVKKDRIYIVRWQMSGALFGPQWEIVADFENNKANKDRCRDIIKLMNECNSHSNHHDI